MLRQMMSDGLIASGDVDERSIVDVQPGDLAGYTRCHFFAGIGGWELALQLAGWPANRHVWTGSCPCQPFSSAGRQKGKTDDRHLWPEWFRLIRKCRPATIFGEQVASAVAHGWLDDVYQGLEAEDYSVGAAVLPACSVGAPHRRDRLWFVAHAANQRSDGRPCEIGGSFRGSLSNNRDLIGKPGDGSVGPVAHAQERGCRELRGAQGSAGYSDLGSSNAVANPEGSECEQPHYSWGGGSRASGLDSVVANTHSSMPRRLPNEADGTGKEVRLRNCLDATNACGSVADTFGQRQQGQGEVGESLRTTQGKAGKTGGIVDAGAGMWEGGCWIKCPDEKQRLIEPSIPLLVDGFQHRKPILHALGNAIVPQVAAEFIRASMS